MTARIENTIADRERTSASWFSFQEMMSRESEYYGFWFWSLFFSHRVTIEKRVGERERNGEEKGEEEKASCLIV